MPAGTTPFAPSSRRRRACSARRYMIANRCPIGGSGGSAHPMMPFYAQGAARSTEDAYILAGCLAASPDEPVAAFERYVKLRQPRIAWMQRLARREEELYQTSDASEIAARNARTRANRIPESATFPPEQERLYGYDAEAILRE
jgi:salicylate hydroxylase